MPRSLRRAGYQSAGIAFFTACLAGCAAIERWNTDVRLSEWVAFVDHVNALEPAEFNEELRASFDTLGNQPSALDRLHLAYLLSRPNLATQDIRKSQLLLTEIPPDSPYAPIRDLLARELDHLTALRSASSRIEELEVQLKTLKSIDADMTKGQTQLEELSK